MPSDVPHCCGDRHAAIRVVCLSGIAALSRDLECTHAVLVSQWLESMGDMTEQEWLELLELEAPSRLGICHPAAAVLDVSEPSFCWESSESESRELDPTPTASLANASDSLRGYSPSPLRTPVNEAGINLDVNLEAIPELLPQLSEAENLAVMLLRQQWATESSFLRLMELLPTTMRAFQDGGGHDSEEISGTFSTGAYVYSSQVGLMCDSSGQ